MEQDDDMYKWFVNMLEDASVFNNGGFMSSYEASRVKQLRLTKLDDGAIRTLWCYMRELSLVAFTYVAWKYFSKYAGERYLDWNVNNPSAALVSLLRYTFYEDESFMRMFKVGRYSK
jgi:hypothetical protein